MSHCGYFFALELRTMTRERAPMLRRFHISHSFPRKRSRVWNWSCLCVCQRSHGWTVWATDLRFGRNIAFDNISDKFVMWRHGTKSWRHLDILWWLLGKNTDKEGTLREGASMLRRFHVSDANKSKIIEIKMSITNCRPSHPGYPGFHSYTWISMSFIFVSHKKKMKTVL